MFTTPVTLLERLREPAARDAWERFVHLYSPLLFHWARRAGLAGDDAGDLVQDVFVILLQKLPEFRHDRNGSFRSWLRTVTFNRWRNLARRKALGPRPAGEDVLADVPAAADDLFEEEEYRRQILSKALTLLEAEFAQTTWRAFREHGLAGRPAAQVAAELGTTVGAVYAAKFRVLARLRAHVTGLLD